MKIFPIASQATLHSSKPYQGASPSYPKGNSVKKFSPESCRMVPSQPQFLSSRPLRRSAAGLKPTRPFSALLQGPEERSCKISHNIGPPGCTTRPLKNMGRSSWSGVGRVQSPNHFPLAAQRFGVAHWLVNILLEDSRYGRSLPYPQKDGVLSSSQ